MTKLQSVLFVCLLSSRPAPYVVHCIEGKDRTGYFSSYLLSHGMSRQEIDALIQALTVF